MRRPRRHRPARDRRRGPQPRCNSGVRGRTSGLSRPGGNNGRPRNGSPNQPGSSRSPTGQARRHFGRPEAASTGSPRSQSRQCRKSSVRPTPRAKPRHVERSAETRSERPSRRPACSPLSKRGKRASERRLPKRPLAEGERALPNLSVRLWPAEVAAASGSAEPRRSLDLGGPWNPLPGARHLYRPPPARA